MVSTFMYANYIGRLMTNGLPSPDARPGMFIAVGPPSFTAIAFIGIANAAIEIGDWVHLHNCRSQVDERSNSLDVDTGAAADTIYE